MVIAVPQITFGCSVEQRCLGLIVSASRPCGIARLGARFDMVTARDASIREPNPTKPHRLNPGGHVQLSLGCIVAP